MRSPSLPGIWLLSILLASASAHAQTQPLGLSHIAEVQFDASVLTPLVKAAALNLRDGVEGLCALPEMDCPPNLNPALAGQRCFLDRVSFPGTVSLRRSTETVHFTEHAGEPFDFFPIQAVVPFDVRLTRVACLSDPSLNCKFGQDDAHASLSAVFDLSTEVNDGEVDVCISYAATLLGPIDISATVAAAAIPRSCQPLSEVSALANKIQTEVQDVQISGSSDLDRLGVRIWFATPQFEVDLIGPSKDTYQKFFDGVLAPTPNNTDWSVFIGEQLLLRLARQNAFTQIQNAVIAGGASVFLDSDEHDPWFTFWVPGPEPTGAVTLYMRLSELGCKEQLSVTAATKFSLDTAAQTLVLSGTFGYDLTISGCLAGLIPAGGELIEVFVNLFLPSASIFALDGLCEISLGDFTFECNVPTEVPVVVPFPGAPAVKVTIDKMFGDAAGVAAGGTLTFSGGPADTTATATIGAFGYGWDGCSTKRPGWFGDLHLDGWGRLCTMSVLNDPQAVYMVKDLGDTHDRTLPKDYVLENRMGAGAPYPFRAVVRTTNGSGLLKLPVPDAISNLEIGKRYAKMISECDAKIAGRIRGWFDPHWRIDPDPPIDVASVLVDNHDRSIPSTVRIQDVRFEAAGPVQRAQRARGEFGLYQQALRMTGRAWVKPRGQSGFHVPVQADLTGNFNGLDMNADARLAQLTLASRVSRRMQVPASALPGGHKSLSFNLLIPANDLTLTGFLPDATLAGSWSFDEGRGSAILDRSGLGNAGAITAAPHWVASGRNGALAFAPASRSVVEVANSRSLNPAAFSISAWFNSATSGQNGFETILAKGTGSNRQYGLGVLPNGRLQFAASGVALEGKTTLSAKEWHHVVATYDGALLRLFVDGRLDGTRLAALSPADNGASLTIGGERIAGAGVSNAFNGALDEVRLYSIALTPLQASSAHW